MGPNNSYFYLGPNNVPGHVAYGNNTTEIHMQYLLQKRREGSTYVSKAVEIDVADKSVTFVAFVSSRYFIAQSGKSYKWRISPQRMEVSPSRLYDQVVQLKNYIFSISAWMAVRP